MEISSLTSCAVLCGDAPPGLVQKKINAMHNFLVSAAGGQWKESEILIFPNGVHEKMLLRVLENLKSQKTQCVLLYICARNMETGENIHLGGEKISKSAVESVLPNECFQVIYDADGETAREDAEE